MKKQIKTIEITNLEQAKSIIEFQFKRLKEQDKKLEAIERVYQRLDDKDYDSLSYYLKGVKDVMNYILGYEKDVLKTINENIDFMVD